jgi:tetratricopeptide (TPR) repeat protein
MSLPSVIMQRWRLPGICLALAAMTFIVFGQTLGHGFTNFDDNQYVVDNPVVAQGLTGRGLAWAFTQAHAANWHPLTWVSHMLDCQIYGLNPAGHHFTNVLLHAAAVIALFLVLRQMTGAVWRSAFVAAVFAIHPLRVESVAWVSERKDVLGGLFFMLTVGAYARHARLPQSLARYGLVVLLFAMGLMCKPMLVTLPLVLLLLDYWPLRRSEPCEKLIVEKLPLLALSTIACIVTISAQKGAIQSNDAYPLVLRLGNALVSIFIYLGQMVWPVGLSPYYPYPRNGLPAWELALSGTVLAALLGAALWQRRRSPWLLIGLIWYLVMLLPVLGIIQVGSQAHADRYTYLPQIGIYIAVTWLVAEQRISRIALAGIMGVTLTLLMICAWRQAAYWASNETLWSHALACTPDNSVGRDGLGAAFLQDGETDEAIEQFQHARDIDSGDTEPHFRLGSALLQKGRVEEAIAQFQQALQIDPDYAEAENSLGCAVLREGRSTDAAAHFQKALQINFDYPEAHYNLANILLDSGRVNDAILQYQYALQINPGYIQAHINLGDAFLQKGSVKEAIGQFQDALRLQPDELEVQNNLAWLLATSSDASVRNSDEAVRLAQGANELAAGKNPVVFRTLAAAFAEAGQFDQAIRAAQKAASLFQAAGRQDLAEQINGDLRRYQMRLPLHP